MLGASRLQLNVWRFFGVPVLISIALGAAGATLVGQSLGAKRPDEAEANAADPILTRLEHQNRVPTLLAKRTGAGEYRFDIHLQGPRETVFFDI